MFLLNNIARSHTYKETLLFPPKFKGTSIPTTISIYKMLLNRHSFYFEFLPFQAFSYTVLLINIQILIIETNYIEEILFILFITVNIGKFTSAQR